MNNTKENQFSKYVRRYLGLLLCCSIATFVACGSASSSAPPPPVKTLVSVAVSPSGSISIPVNGTQQFTATGTYSDSTTQNLTSLVTWASSDTSIVTVNASGLATGVSNGNVNITATMGAVSGSRAMAVTPVLTTINVTPASPSAVVNTTTQLTAIGIWSDNSSQEITSQVTWATVDTSVATVDNTGLATAMSPGSTNLMATLGTISGSTTLTVDPATLVSIVISPDQTSVPAGISQAFVATGTFNNNTTQDLAIANWSSSDATVASIDNSGNANTLKAGTVTISATSGSVTGTTTFTVLPATLVSISFSPASPSLALGTTQQITAIGLFTDGSTQNLGGVSWTSSDPTIATIDANGNLTTVAVGNVTITATLGSISNTVSASVTPATLASITVTPANPSIAAGNVQQFTATGTFTDSTTQDLTSSATWVSSAANVATVDGSGLASGLSAGTATISANFGSISGGTVLTVTPAQLLSIDVNPQGPTMAVGTTLQLTATGKYSDSTTPDISAIATWTSSSTVTASVDATGNVTGRKAGTATITATLNGVSGSTTVTVSNHTLLSIVVTPANPSVSAGQNKQFTATAYFNDGTNQDITRSAHWSSSSSKVATINSGQTGGGLSTAKSAGTVTITATLNGVSGTTTLTVN